MRRFHCVCGNEVFFESHDCLSCGRALGFWPPFTDLIALTPEDDDHWRRADEVDLGERFRFCANRQQAPRCNWLLDASNGLTLCRGCATTRIIPSLHIDANAARWKTMEEAKRRLLYSLLRLGLEFDSMGPYGTAALCFAFKEDQRTNAFAIEDYVTTGHEDGLVTINVAEADTAYRETIRESFGQGYRTVLGHLRHESGHFYFDRLLRSSPALDNFRRLFGSERIDYTQALTRFYAEPPRSSHPDYVSAYASAHPLEDWAECWAHVLHIEDTLETAQAYGLTGAEALVAHATWLERWGYVSVMLNELNRSLGQPDAYPFVITHTVASKLDFTRLVIRQAGHAIGNGAGY